MVLPGADGAPGLLIVTGSYTQAPIGTLSIDLGGTTPISQYDQIDMGGNAALDGVLYLNLLSGYIPNNGDQFDILNAGSVTGLFSAIYCSDPSLFMDVNFTTNQVQIDITSQFGGSIVILHGGKPPNGAVPEPGPMALVAAALLGGLLQRRRSRQSATSQRWRVGIR